MNAGAGPQRSENIQWIRAAREKVYAAFLDPKELSRWLAPEGMTGRVHRFEGRVGGGYEMSLFHDEGVEGVEGKTEGREDRFTARFVELDPPARIVQLVDFHSPDPAFHGEMRMTVSLAVRDAGTEVRILFEDIPPGIRPADNEAGTASSLKKLARLMEG